MCGCGEKKNMVSALLILLGVLVLLVGAWMYNWKWAVVALVIMVVGKIVWKMQNKKAAPRAVTKKKRR
jgi:type II secretory pathway component PulF